MNRDITIPFRLPLPRRIVRRLANLLQMTIEERVNGQYFIRTIPDALSAKWKTETRERHHANELASQPGFHLVLEGRCGSIYYVDGTGRICDCDFELGGGGPTLIIFPESLTEWFLPAIESITEPERSDILLEMRDWLRSRNTTFEM